MNIIETIKNLITDLDPSVFKLNRWTAAQIVAEHEAVLISNAELERACIQAAKNLAELGNCNEEMFHSSMKRVTTLEESLQDLSRDNIELRNSIAARDRDNQSLKEKLAASDSLGGIFLDNNSKFEAERDQYRTARDLYIEENAGLKVKISELSALLDTIKKLQDQLALTDKLLDERNRVLATIPECPAHGECLPHYEDWINFSKIAREERDNLMASTTMLIGENKELRTQLTLMASKNRHKSVDEKPFIYMITNSLGTKAFRESKIDADRYAEIQGSMTQVEPLFKNPGFGKKFELLNSLPDGSTLYLCRSKNEQ